YRTTDYAARGTFETPSPRSALDLRPDLRRNRRTQRAVEGAPLAGQLEACGRGMEVGTAPRLAPARVDHDRSVRAPDEPDELGLAGLLAAGDAGPDRPLSLRPIPGRITGPIPRPLPAFGRPPHECGGVTCLRQLVEFLRRLV